MGRTDQQTGKGTGRATDRKRDRQTNRQEERQADQQTGRETGRPTEREGERCIRRFLGASNIEEINAHMPAHVIGSVENNDTENGENRTYIILYVFVTREIVIDNQ